MFICPLITLIKPIPGSLITEKVLGIITRLDLNRVYPMRGRLWPIKMIKLLKNGGINGVGAAVRMSKLRISSVTVIIISYLTR